MLSGADSGTNDGARFEKSYHDGAPGVEPARSMKVVQSQTWVADQLVCAKLVSSLEHPFSKFFIE